MPAYRGEAGGWFEEVMQHLPYIKMRENGKMCPSMIAKKERIDFDEKRAQCVEIDIKDDSYCRPFKGRNPKFKVNDCDLPMGKTKCECSLSGNNLGSCAIPPSRLHKEYATAMVELFPNITNCHTLDRENLLAIGECGVGGYNSPGWEKAANLRLEMETYP